MPRHLRVRIAFVLLVVAVSVWYLYPVKSALNLGLDLQGGIHLMLGVEADRHVASQTDRAAEDLKSALERKGIAVKRGARARGSRSSGSRGRATPRCWSSWPIRSPGTTPGPSWRSSEPSSGVTTI